MKIDMKKMFLILAISSILILCGNGVIYIKKIVSEASGASPSLPSLVAMFIESLIRSIPGILILIAFSMAGLLCKKCIPLKLPAAAYIITIGCILSIPGAPGATDGLSMLMNTTSSTIMKYVSEINFMSLTTPVLAYAGLSLAKDLDALVMSGWRIIVVSVFVFIGTFLGSALIADIILRLAG